MNVLIYTAMNERHKVSELWCRAIARFIAAAPDGITCQVLAVISQPESEEILNHYGFQWVYEENKPLGRKFNTGLNYALGNINFDYLLLMGDDDLILPEAWIYYEPWMEAQLPYFGFRSLYFYSPAQRKAVLFDYINSAAANKLVGCGRMFHHLAIRRAAYVQSVKFSQPYNYGTAIYPAHTMVQLPEYKARYFIGMKLAKAISEPVYQLWRPDQNSGLDNESEIKMLMNGFEPVVIETEEPLMIDVKTSKNIWKFNNFISVGDAVDEATIAAMLDPDLMAYIDAHLRDDKEDEPMQGVFVKLSKQQMMTQQQENSIMLALQKVINQMISTRFPGHQRPAPGSITAFRLPDNKKYLEFWINQKTPDAVFVAGVHWQLEQDGVQFYFDTDPMNSQWLKYQAQQSPTSSAA